MVSLTTRVSPRSSVTLSSTSYLYREWAISRQVLVNLALDDLHDLTGTVLQSLGKDDDGIRLYHDLHEDGVIHVVLAFGKGHHPAVSTVAGIEDGGTYGMAGAGTSAADKLRC